MPMSVIEIIAAGGLALTGSGFGGWKMISFVRKLVKESEARALDAVKAVDDKVVRTVDVSLCKVQHKNVSDRLAGIEDTQKQSGQLLHKVHVIVAKIEGQLGDS